MSLIFKKILLLIFISVIVSAITILIILIVNKNNNPTLHTPKTTVAGVGTCWTGGEPSHCATLTNNQKDSLLELISTETKDQCTWDGDKMSCSMGDINLDSPFPNSDSSTKYRDYLDCICHGNGWCTDASQNSTCVCNDKYDSEDSCSRLKNETVYCTGSGYYKVPYPAALTYKCGNGGDDITLTDPKLTFASNGSWQNNNPPLTEPFSWWQRIHMDEGSTMKTKIGISLVDDTRGEFPIGDFRRRTIWLKLTYGINQYINVKPSAKFSRTRSYSSDWIFENFSGITFFDEQTTYGNIMSCKDDKNENSIQRNCYPGSQYTIRFRYQHDKHHCVDLENGGVYQTMPYTIYPPKDSTSDVFWTETSNEVLFYIGGDKYMSDDKNKPQEARCCSSQAPDGACLKSE